MSDELNKRLQPELDRLYADHERTMRLIAEMREPTEAEKRAMAEMATPEAVQRTIREIIDGGALQRRNAKLWLIAGVVVGVTVCALLLTLWLQLPQSN